MLRLAVWAILGFTILLGAGQPLRAQAPAESPPAKPAAPAIDGQSDLAQEQQQLAEKYRRFEEVLVRMAELTAPTDPKRAALLRKGVAESKQQAIGQQLQKISEILAQDRLSVALSGQADVNKDLSKLLDLLLTEERAKGLQEERARLKEQIRQIGEMINKERQLQGQTAGKGEMRKLAEGQEKLAEQAAKLAEQMQDPSAAKSKDADAADGDKPAEAKPGDAKPDDQREAGKNKKDDKKDDKNQDGKPADGDKESKKSGDSKEPGDQPENPAKPAGGKPGEKEEKPGQPGDKGGEPSDAESKESKSGEQSQSPPAPGESGESKEGEGQPSEQNEQPPSPTDSARKRVEAAQQKMEQAQKKLEEAQREGAVEEQEAAIRDLEQAKAELEEILRQLREEEKERMLALLEARFRKMLQAQIEVYEGTKRVDQTPAAERDRDDEIEASRLSRKEAQIALEAETALSILHEEGSAVAFPEAVEQMHEDMELIVTRLARADVGEITRGIEEDVIAALEEMIAALEKAQQDLEKQKQQQAQQQQGEEQDPPLVDTLAELKMIRALQMRVNLRTKRLSALVEGNLGQAETPELLEQLRRLAEREESVFRVTRDIVTGKNR